MIRNFSLSFTMLLLSLDTFAIVASIAIAEFLRINLPFGLDANRSVFNTPLSIYLVLMLSWLLIIGGVGGYSPRQTHRAALEVSKILYGVGIAVFIFSGIFFLVYRDFSRLQLIYILVNLTVINIGVRGLLRLYFRMTGGRRYDSRRVLIVGVGDLAVSVGRVVRSYAWTGLYLVGYVSNGNANSTSPEGVLGDVAQLNGLLKEHAIDEVIFALQQSDYAEMLTLVEPLYKQHHNLHVRIAPDVQEVAYLSHLTIEDVNGMPLIGLRDNVLTLQERVLKRAMDIALSAALLVFTTPLMAAICIAIMLDSKGTPFFVQERVGQGMRAFRMIKFRTMVQNAEAMQSEVNQYDADGNLVHKSPNDKRVTRVGRFLRRTSLDELPQFFNILIGNMSLVGPRPELPWMVERYEDWQMKRFEVPQGLTGWWQINGRAETPMHLATEDDLFYINNYSLILDLIILLRTPFAVMSRKGAF